MAFKLGKAKGLQAQGGNIKSKFKFKSGDEIIPGTPVYRKKLGENILAEANMDGSIFVSKDYDINDPIMRYTIAHEMQHITKMKTGEETYDDNAVYHQGQVWPRTEIAGQAVIMDPNTGKYYPEGSKDLPWENNKI